MRVATSVQTIYGNLTELCHSAFARVATRSLRPIRSTCAFATAHSRGLRRKCLEIEKDYDALPQRIRAGCDAISAPVVTMLWPLPQRIRAGCDSHRERYRVPVAAFATAHSRGLRRVECAIICSRLIFATAHSRGLRPPPANRKNRIIHFATAHSCGLRR